MTKPSQPNREKWEKFMDSYDKPLYTIGAKNDILNFWESIIEQALAEQTEGIVKMIDYEMSFDMGKGLFFKGARGAYENIKRRIIANITAETP